MPSKLPVLALALGLAVVGCTGDTDGDAARGLGSGPDAGHAAPATTTIWYDTAYSGQDEEVAAGGTVQWVAAGGGFHTVTWKADYGLPNPGSFDASHSVTFPRAGIFEYECGLHDHGSNSITVR